MAEEGAARALPSRPREQPRDPNKPAKGHQGGARGPSPGARKGGGTGVRSRRSYSSEGGGGGYGAGSGEIGRLTCSSRCSRYRSLRGQHGASASSSSSRGAKRARLGRERARPWRRETGVAWALAETREKERRAKPRESENSEGWQGSTEAQRAPSGLGRESARGKIPPPPDAYARALEADTLPGIPGAAHWSSGPLGIVAPRSLVTRQRFPFGELIRGGEEAEEREPDCRGSSTTELQLPAGHAGRTQPARGPAQLLVLSPGPGPRPRWTQHRTPTGRV